MSETKAHIIVIGAGMVGVATAIWLQRAGEAVTLIDREGPAAGASYGNAGVLAAGSVVPVTVPGLIAKAPKMLFDPMQPLFLQWRYLPRLIPFLWRFLSHSNAKDVERISLSLHDLLADTADQHRSLAAGTPAERFIHDGDYVYGYKNYATYKADAFTWGVRSRRGLPIEELSGDALRDYDPQLVGRFGFAVRYGRHGMISDPGAYIMALYDHFVAQGGKFVQATISDLITENGAAKAVETDQGVIPAARIVMTTGASSQPFAKKLGVKVRLEAERGYHLEFVNPNITLRSPTMVTAGKFVATPMEGRLRCAGVAEFASVDAPPSEAPYRLLEKQTAAIFPDLTYDRIDRWMGRRPSTTDSLPVIGEAPGARNVWLGYGHQHVGLSGGPKTGRWLSQIITGQTPNEDLSPFAADRAA